MNTIDNDFGYKFGNFSVDINTVTRNKPITDVINLLVNWLGILKENIIVYDTIKEKYINIFDSKEIENKKLIVSIIGNKSENNEIKIFIIVKNSE